MHLITAIMAGGLGKRMKTSKPKVLNLVKNKPMICHVIEQAIEAGSLHILIIVGKFKEEIKSAIELEFSIDILSKITYINQPEPLGTGHAVKCCIHFFKENNISVETNVLILSGDVPLIQSQTIGGLLSRPNSLLITQLENPTGCGRIIFDGSRKIIHCIVEEKDCEEEQREIKYVNCGIYNLTVETILKYIPLINNNNKSNEYYLTDIIEISKSGGLNIGVHELPKEKQYEIININTAEDLILANS